MSFRIHFHDDVPHSKRIGAECERISSELHEDFPELAKTEVAISVEGGELETRVHVRGKDIDLASTGKAKEMHDSVVEAFDRVKKQLRKHHDKVTFKGRRDGH
ncbi:MAG: HPF/RaiA family ribosome-associated protein [bacterium]|nr:HPF/RaiA family ribosome-associated protein [bacterium]